MLVTVLQFASGLLAGAAWLFLVYIGKADANLFVGTLQTLLGALIVHLVHQATDNTPAVAAPAPARASLPAVQQAEGGFARPLFLVVLALCAVALSACATGYRTALDTGLAQAKAADDNLVLTYKAAMCGLPLSAILRNADIIPGIKALCLPGGNASDPNGILPDPNHGPVQVQIVPNQVGQGK